MSYSFLTMFKPKPGSFGQMLSVTAVALGTAGGTTIAGSTTTSVILPKPNEKCYLKSISLSALTAAASAGGTVLAQVFKRDNSGTPADRILTAATSIEADVITVADSNYAVTITGSNAYRVFQKTDACRVDVVAGSSLETQPIVQVVATWAMME